MGKNKHMCIMAIISQQAWRGEITLFPMRRRPLHLVRRVMRHQNRALIISGSQMRNLLIDQHGLIARCSVLHIALLLLGVSIIDVKRKR